MGQFGEKRARGSKCLKEEMDALVWLFGGGADEHGAEGTWGGRASLLKG